MFIFKTAIILSGIALLSKVSAHGIVTGIIAGGKYSEGYHPSFAFATIPPIVPGWSIPEDSNWGYVSDYSSPDIICHKAATPGGSYVNVTAGGTVELQWSPWPEGHKGPMIDYLARCFNDDCTSVDKTTLLFNKIDQKGLIDGSVEPGTWASDQMRLNNNSWTTTIPSSIAPGKYVLRHETIALHQALDIDGAQNYPQCVNLEINGSGTDSLQSGTLGTSLYHNTDPGLFINIYETLTNYTIPGPPLYSGASGNPQPSESASSSSQATTATSTSPETTTSASSYEWSAWPSSSESIVAPTSQESTAPASSGVFPSYANSTTVIYATRPPGIGPKPTRSSGIYHNHHSPSTDVATPNSPLSEIAASSAPTEIPIGQPTGPVPVSFTSTVTGRIGKPTEFVCYAVA
ncbi:hypothetical protein DV736_g4688, partial [Chaetothyriales sp. CBS 134916]